MLLRVLKVTQNPLSGPGSDTSSTGKLRFRLSSCWYFAGLALSPQQPSKSELTKFCFKAMDFPSHLYKKIADHLKRICPDLLLEKEAPQDENGNPSDLPDSEYQMFKHPDRILSGWFESSKFLKERDAECAISVVQMFNQRCDIPELSMSKYCQLAQSLSIKWGLSPADLETARGLRKFIQRDAAYHLYLHLSQKTAEQLIELFEDATRWIMDSKMKDDDFKCPEFVSCYRPLNILLGTIVAVLVSKNVKYEDIAQSWKKMCGDKMLTEHILRTPPKKEKLKTHHKTLDGGLKKKILQRAFALLPTDTEIISMNSSIKISSEILRFSWEYFNNFLKCQNETNQPRLTDEEVGSGIKYKVDLGRRLTPDTLRFIRSHFYGEIDTKTNAEDYLPLRCLALFGEELRLFNPPGSDPLDDRIYMCTRIRSFATTRENFVYAMVWGLENNQQLVVEEAAKGFDSYGWKVIGSQKEWILAQPELMAEITWKFLIH